MISETNTKLSNNIISFKSQLTGEKELRVFGTSESPWFVGKDIAEFLEYKDTKQSIREHVDEEDKITFEKFLGGLKRHPNELQCHTILINESGLYSLILRSKMEKAKLFKRWITSEVLPSIRKYGSYEIEAGNRIQASLPQEVVEPLKLEAQKLSRKVDRTISANTSCIYLYYVGNRTVKLGYSKDTMSIRNSVHQKDDDFLECILVYLWQATNIVETDIHKQLKDFRANKSKTGKRETYIIDEDSSIVEFIDMVTKYIEKFTTEDKLVEENKDLRYKLEITEKDLQLSKKDKELELSYKDNEILKKDLEIVKKDLEIVKLKNSQSVISVTDVQNNRICRTCNISKSIKEFGNRSDKYVNFVCKRCCLNKQQERRRLKRQ